MNDKNPFLFSVIICTYNRADLLNKAIQSLLEQDYESKNFEILIIDNSSVDSTNQIAQNYLHKRNNMKYYIEENIGLSYARNRGMKESKGKYIAFLDDDAIAPPHWLSTANALLRSVTSDCFGGPFFACYNSEKAKWFKDEYGSFTLGKTSRSVSSGEFLVGGNFFIKRDLLLQMGGFNSEYGMKGKAIGVGEETLLQIRLRNTFPNINIYFEPELFIYHLVRKEKMQFSYLCRLFYSSGRDSYRIFSQTTFPNELKIKQKIYMMLIQYKEIYKKIVEIIKHLTLKINSRDKNVYPYLENYVYEVCLPLFSQLAMTIEGVRIIQRIPLRK